MSDDKVIVLPDRDEMLRRLNEIEDDGYTRERFFPYLLQHAGQEKVALGVSLLIALAIHDFTRGMPPVVAALIYMKADKYVDALVDHKEVAEEAKAALHEAIKQ